MKVTCLGRVAFSAFTCLALSAGVSKADEVDPSIDDERKDPVFQVIKVSEQSWYEAEDKAVAREIASPRNSKARAMSIAEIIIPAGVEVVPHHHVMEEVYYIVEGEGMMMVEDETRLVQAGEAVVIAPHQWHNIRNHTKSKLKLIVICSPPWAPGRLEFDRSTVPED